MAPKYLTKGMLVVWCGVGGLCCKFFARIFSLISNVLLLLEIFILPVFGVSLDRVIRGTITRLITVIGSDLSFMIGIAVSVIDG